MKDRTVRLSASLSACLVSESINEISNKCGMGV
jgi:hypothetical protein